MPVTPVALSAVPLPAILSFNVVVNVVNVCLYVLSLFTVTLDKLIFVVPVNIVPFTVSDTAPPVAPKSASMPRLRSLLKFIDPRFRDSLLPVLRSNIVSVLITAN